MREVIFTSANCVTLLRAVTSTLGFVLAIAQHSTALMFGGLVLNMALDCVDGAVACWLREETTLGAQLDGAVDRLAVTLLVLTVMTIRDDSATAAIGTLVWLQFGVVDYLLSSQFLRFGLWSPDHFHEVDEGVWRVNWSPVAKLAGNVPVLLLAASPMAAWAAIVPAMTLLALRIRSYRRVRERAKELLPEMGYAYRPRASQHQTLDQPPSGTLRVDARLLVSGVES